MNLGSHMIKFDRLNSATKYPSIETYHELGEKGRLTANLGPFSKVQPNETVYLTEKIDGTNGRIVFMPDGDYFIGTREYLVYAKGDRVLPSTGEGLAVVQMLRPVADRLLESPELSSGMIEVLYFEVYGGKIGGQAKQYTSDPSLLGHRLFDHAFIGPAILDWVREDIARWREHGGQTFQEVTDLIRFSASASVSLETVPYLTLDNGQDLPKSVEDMYTYLKGEVEETAVRLDGSSMIIGKPEGLVLRTEDRRCIAKARFQDYERTLGIQK